MCWRGYKKISVGNTFRKKERNTNTLRIDLRLSSFPNLKMICYEKLQQLTLWKIPQRSILRENYHLAKNPFELEPS